MSFRPPQPGSCPLVLSHDTSWAHVPKAVALKGGGAQGALCPKSLVSLLPGGTSAARLLGLAGLLQQPKLCTHLPSSTTLGSSSFLEPHCFSLPPSLQEKLSILSLTGLPDSDLQEQGLGLCPPYPEGPCAPSEN